MTRRMKIPSRELGDLDVLTISETGGEWEGEWDLLRETVIGGLVTKVSREVMDHALHGLTRPLVDILGLPPEGALRKLPSISCAKQGACTLYDQHRCRVASSKLPWCYEPAGVSEDSLVLSVAAQAVFYWKDKTYLIVVKEDE